VADFISLSGNIKAELLHQACLFFVMRNMNDSKDMLQDPRITKDIALKIMEMNDVDWYSKK